MRKFLKASQIFLGYILKFVGFGKLSFYNKNTSIFSLIDNRNY